MKAIGYKNPDAIAQYVIICGLFVFCLTPITMGLYKWNS